MGEKINGYMALGKEKRPLGITRHSSEDNIKMVLTEIG
jgi:hypothetical protein